MSKKPLFLLILAFIMISCGPMYKTLYTYHAPQTSEGRYCVNSCSSMQQQCNSQCNNNEQNCEMRIQSMEMLQQSTCYASGKKDCGTFYHHKHYECDSKSCKEACEYQYNQCYSNCGGSVESQTVCVANCEKK